MDFENIINNLKKTTTSLVRNEDWENLTSISQTEPNQIFYFTEIIEQQIKKIISRNEEIFEPVPNNPSYFRFKPGIEFVLKLIRDRSGQFNKEFKEFLLENLFPVLKEEKGYYSTLDLFFNALHFEIKNNSKFLEKTIEFPHLLKKLIKDDSKKIINFYPSIYNKEDYHLGYLFIKEQPNLLNIYESESTELIKNLILGGRPYKELFQLLKEHNPKLIPILEKKRSSLKKDFLNDFLTTKKESIQYKLYSKYKKYSKLGRIFDYSFDLFTDGELVKIIQKIIELGFTYRYDDNDTNWMHFILLEIGWHEKVDLLQDYINELAELNHLQVLKSYFLQRPERIRESTNFIIEKLGSFTIDLLERRYNSFDIANPIEFFHKILEKNKNYYTKVIKVFFDNNKDFIVKFKHILLSKLKNLISIRETEEPPNYYFISGSLNYIYFYYPNYKVDIDEDLINQLFNLILNNSSSAEHLNYVEFLRNKLHLLKKPLQTKFLSQLIKNKCIPCIEYYIKKNLNIFSQNIDVILSYQPRDENDSDYYIRPLEYIVRKKYKEDKPCKKNFKPNRRADSFTEKGRIIFNCQSI